MHSNRQQPSPGGYRGGRKQDDSYLQAMQKTVPHVDIEHPSHCRMLPRLFQMAHAAQQERIVPPIRNRQGHRFSMKARYTLRTPPVKSSDYMLTCRINTAMLDALASITTPEMDRSANVRAGIALQVTAVERARRKGNR